MSKGALKAIGERGSWFAKVNGERLPCVHQHWVRGLAHLDPNYDPDEPKFLELFEAIPRGKRVILTRDNVVESSTKKSGIAFERIGYIAVFNVDGVNVDSNGLSFHLLKRVCDLK